MKNILTVFICLFLAASFSSLAERNQDPAKLEQIKEKESDDRILRAVFVEKVWYFLNEIVTKYGDTESGAGGLSIEAGSTFEQDMLAYVAKRVKEEGLELSSEQFPVKTFFSTPCEFYVNDKRIGVIYAYGSVGTYGTNMGSNYYLGSMTNKEILEGILINLGKGEPQDFEKEGSLTNKVVLLESDKSAYPSLEIPITEAKNKGAKAVIIVPPNQEKDFQKVFKQSPVISDIPVYFLSPKEAERTKKELSKGNAKVHIRNVVDILKMTSSSAATYIRGNVYPNEYIVFGAQVDRWFTSPYGTSCALASLIELANGLKRSGYKNRRTFVFVAFSGKETGGTYPTYLSGPADFVTKHSEITNGLALYINLNLVGGNKREGKLFISRDIESYITKFLSDKGYDQTFSVDTNISPKSAAYPFYGLGGASVVDLVRENSGSQFLDSDRNHLRLLSKENLKEDLRLLFSLALAFDKMTVLPYEFSKYIEWFTSEAKPHLAKLKEEGEFPEFLSAIDKISVQTKEIERTIDNTFPKSELDHTIPTSIQSEVEKKDVYESFNKILISTRRNIIPVTLALGGEIPAQEVQNRLYQYASDLINLKSAIFSLKIEDELDAKSYLEAIHSMSWGTKVSYKTYEEIINKYNREHSLWLNEYAQFRYYLSPQIFKVWESIKDKKNLIQKQKFNYKTSAETLLNIYLEMKKDIYKDTLYISKIIWKQADNIEKFISELKKEETTK